VLFSSPLPYYSDATAYFAAIMDLPWAAWLDSARLGRYDILCAQPVRTLVTHGMHTEIGDANGVSISNNDPFELLRRELAAADTAIPDIPFAGGALGYWGYDLGHRSLKLTEHSPDARQLPDMAIGIYDWALILDHKQQSAQLVSQLHDPNTKEQLPQILLRLQNAVSAGKTTNGELCSKDIRAGVEAFKVHGKIRTNYTRSEYETAFHAVKEYLQSGDCYQVNLAQQFSAQASGNAFEAYLTLRSLSPAPYSAFINLPQAQILCASPECFLKVDNGRVETRPIKGTRPRSNDVRIDSRLALELAIHPKDRAENLMIVDLLRNDLGKCCAPGTVRVPKLFEVESFANVHHLVSTIEGQMVKGCDALQVLCDCFPGGSVTGAPKVRAMQIIAELEPQCRGIYCGTIGYAGFDGNLDSNIVIRTLVHSDNEIYCWAGGGIVADSDAEGEYQETLDKASGMMDLMRMYGGE